MSYHGMNLLIVQMPLKNWTSWSHITLSIWVHSNRQPAMMTIS